MSEAAIQALLEAHRPGDQECQCCGNEPGVGVASIPGVPMSIMWGRKCLTAGAVPLWILFAQAGPLDDEELREASAQGVVFGRDHLAEWWLAVHDATLEYFGVQDSEFWEAVNREP